jgi:hypothetical protein
VRRALALLLLGLVTATLAGPTVSSAGTPAAPTPTPQLFLPVVGKQPSATATQTATPSPTATTTPVPAPDPRQFGYGVDTADPGGNGGRVQAMGFAYVKAYLSWATSEPVKGQYQWLTAPNANDANNLATAAARHGLRLILRVDTPPSWAAPGSGNRPPSNPTDYGDFLGALAAYLKGRVVAYELWNEPNLSYEWGNQAPNPEAYARLLQAAYPRIRSADPNALVISAGLASTGGDGGTSALNDLDFLQRMYAAGARGSFDVLGSHPYGFANSPDARNANNVTDFRRAADQYQVMVANGDAGKAVWATEFGWLLDPTYYGHPEYLNDPLWAGRQWQRVDPQVQATYLVAAYQYAITNWPWMGLMFVSNLDFSIVPYYPPAEPLRWYAIMNEDRSPRPAYDALQKMAKPVR